MKTFTATPKDIQHDWYVVDAEGMVLGRLASQIARIIRGKHKPTFTPHMDMGDNVIVINASKVVVTGRKAEQKTYFAHTAGERTRETGFRMMDFIQENTSLVAAMGLSAVWLIQQRNRSEISGDRMARFAYTGPERRRPAARRPSGRGAS